jgi:cytoskeletal protein CcmA (bactofilin family)
MAMETKTVKQTLVEEGTEFKGTLKSSCPVVVNGTIDGELEAPEVTISRPGSVLGAIRAKKLRSQGMLSGNVDAGEVFLSGAVRSNTVIKAKSLEVKIGSSDKGSLEVTFGECDLDVNNVPAEPEISTDGVPLSSTAIVSDSSSADGWESLELGDSSPTNSSASGRSTWKSSRR